MHSGSIADASSSPVQVYCRLRPISSGAPHGSLFSIPTPTTINIHTSRNAVGGVLNNATESFDFTALCNVFSASTSQEQIFDTVVKDLVEAAVHEHVDGCVLAYGQTGAGKTYTMLGGGGGGGAGSVGGDKRGLVARAIAAAFTLRRRDTVIRFSMIELFEGRIIDLLIPAPQDFTGLKAEMDADAAGSASGKSRAFSIPLPSSAAPQLLTVAEDRHGNTYITGGLHTPIVRTESEALELLSTGSSNRALASHALNDVSTRAHCIMTLYFEVVGGGGGMNTSSSSSSVSSRLDLVDLAGSERVAKTNAAGARLREAAAINKSLSALTNVILALKEASKISPNSGAAATTTYHHIPYRSSKLTHLLKGSLGGGHGRTRLLACLWPDDAHAEECVATMRFAAACAAVKIRVHDNNNTNGDGDGDHQQPSLAITRLLAATRSERNAALAEVALLRAELALHDEIAGRGSNLLHHSTLTEEEEITLARNIEVFINKEDDDDDGDDAAVPLLGGILPSVRHGEIALRSLRSKLRASMRATATATAIAATATAMAEQRSSRGGNVNNTNKNARALLLHRSGDDEEEAGEGEEEADELDGGGVELGDDELDVETGGIDKSENELAAVIDKSDGESEAEEVLVVTDDTSSSGFGDSTVAKTRNSDKALLIRASAARASASAASASAASAEAAREVAEEKRVERENIREQREIERERERGAERAAAAITQAEFITTSVVASATNANTNTTTTTTTTAVVSDASAAAIREAAVVEWTKTSKEYAQFVHSRSFLRETRAHYTASVARVNETKKIVDSCLHTIANSGGSNDINGEGASERLAAAKILYRMQHADAAALLKEAESQKTQCDDLEKIAAAAFEAGWSASTTSL